MPEPRRRAHVEFLTLPLSALKANADLPDALRDALRLPAADGGGDVDVDGSADGGVGAALALPGELFFPLPAEFEPLQRDLLAAGMRFLGGGYAARGDALTKEVLRLLGVRKPDARAAAGALLDLHAAAGAAGVDAGQRDVHLKFFAKHAEVIRGDPELLELVQRHVRLPAQCSGSGGDGGTRLLPAAELRLPLSGGGGGVTGDAGELEALQRDLSEAGVMAFLAHSELPVPEALVELLGVRAARAADVAAALAALHAAGSAAVPEGRRRAQLEFLGAHASEVLRDAERLKALRASLLLPAADGGPHARGGELFFALGPAFEALQADMLAAGMHFLGGGLSDVTAAAAPAARAALEMLGVRSADAGDVVRRVLRLYGGGASRPPPGAAANAGHVAFICSQWALLAPDVRDAVLATPLLALAPPCGAAEGAAEGAAGFVAPGTKGLFLTPREDSGLRGVLRALQQGGARFISERYCLAPPPNGGGGRALRSDASGEEVRLWLRLQLGVSEMTEGEAAARLLAAHADAARLLSTHNADEVAGHAALLQRCTGSGSCSRPLFPKRPRRRLRRAACCWFSSPAAPHRAAPPPARATAALAAASLRCYTSAQMGCWRACCRARRSPISAASTTCARSRRATRASVATASTARTSPALRLTSASGRASARGCCRRQSRQSCGGRRRMAGGAWLCWRSSGPTFQSMLPRNTRRSASFWRA